MKLRNSKNYSGAVNVLALAIGILFWSSCKDLTELNINPNGASEEEVNANLLMPTVLTESAKLYVNLGYQDIAGVVQHTQKDAWSEGHKDYDWGGEHSRHGY